MERPYAIRQGGNHRQEVLKANVRTTVLGNRQALFLRGVSQVRAFVCACVLARLLLHTCSETNVGNKVKEEMGGR